MPGKIRFCPNCGSMNVEPDTENRAEVAISGGNPNKWMCNDCRYTGMMPVGDPDEDFEEGIEAEFEPPEKYERYDLGFGRGYLKFLIYVTLPATAIYLLYLVI